MNKAGRIKRIRRILSFLTVICCLAGCLGTVSAASGTGSGGGRAGTTVLFENEEEQIPLLSVTKKVTPRGTAPETDFFTFTLEFQEGEGEAWQKTVGKRYTVYDAEGNLVTQLVNGYEQDYFTVSNLNTFTLKDGQRAEFDFLAVGWNYRIKEQKKEGYTLKSITGGGEGTMILGRTEVVAENSYAVKTEKLEVSKEVIFPENYTAPESPVFQYQLRLPQVEDKTKRYSYTLYRDTASGRVMVSEGMLTDTEGKFSLQGGQTAVFEDLPQDMIYEVEELGLAPESQERADTDWKSWWLTEGGWVRQGSTSGAEPVIFRNTNTSFGVSKRLADYSELPEDLSGEELEKERKRMTFTFLLTDGDSAIAGAEYYLYHSLSSYSHKRGTRVDNEIHRTEQDGSFTLLPGQTAIFIGVEPGSSYKVSEMAALNPYYRQTVPASLEGYELRKVGTVPGRVLEFVNEPAPTGLRVVKSVENYKGEQPPDGKTEFRFRLDKKTSPDKDENAGYEPVAGYEYKIGQESYTTDAEGCFTLRANQEALFERLTEGTVYKVTEITDGEDVNSVEYEFKELTITSDGAGGGESSTVSGEPAGEAVLEAGKTLTFAFRNSYVPDKLDLTLYKVNQDGNPLAGAEFKLYYGETTSPDAAVKNPDGAEGKEDVFISGEDGKVTVTGLKAGTYTLQEVKSPSGYLLLANPIQLEIVRKGSQIQVAIGDKTFSDMEKLREGVQTGNEDAPMVSVQLNPEGNDLVILTVRNGKLYNLPHAGGRGIYWYSISGMLLMMAAALILYRYKFKNCREVGKD